MNRIRSIFFFLLCIALVLCIRLYFVQIIHGHEYVDKADHQYVSANTNIFDRGTIFFQNKDGSLLSAASLSTGYIISLNPQKITDASVAYNSLKDLLNLNVDTFYAEASQKNTQYVKIAEEVPEDLTDKISALKIPGVEITKERWRTYPGDSLAARTLGFVGYDANSNLVGRYGLEKYYDDVLSRDDSQVYVNFFAEIFSNIKQSLSDNKQEGDIVTSIEPTVQDFLEKEVNAVSTKYRSKMTGGIIIDPNTGEIYSMALTPSFDPNNYGNVKDISVFNNPLVEGLYEMGSIIKPLTVAAGLDAGVITADTKYNDTGFTTLNGSTIHNYDGKARGVVAVQQVLSQSLNVGAAWVERQIGNAKFADYMRAYGLGEETGIDLPGENHGRLDNLSSPRDIEYATASFGQGISLTPIATARALSVLANGGKLIIPHIVKRINYTTGLFNNISYVDQATQVLKKTTSEEITRMLVLVVDKALANGKVMMPHYSIAAKTGTAQIANPAGGYYSDTSDHFLHSFFGYFPAYNPRFLIFLYTVEPQGVPYASETLTTPFMDTVKFLINYYNIPPDR